MRYTEPNDWQPSPNVNQVGPPRKRPVWPFFLLGALLLLCCAGGIIQVAKSLDDSPQRGVNGQIYVSTTPNPPSSAGKRTSHAPPPPATIGEGQWVIGEDAEPGRYKTDGADPDLFTMCVWSVYAKEGGDVLSFGSSGDQRAPGRVTLKKGQFFDTTGCQPWVRQSS